MNTLMITGTLTRKSHIPGDPNRDLQDARTTLLLHSQTPPKSRWTGPHRYVTGDRTHVLNLHCVAYGQVAISIDLQCCPGDTLALWGWVDWVRDGSGRAILTLIVHQWERVIGRDGSTVVAPMDDGERKCSGESELG